MDRMEERMGRLIVLLTIVVSGCGPYYTDPRSFRGVEGELGYYVSIFETLHGRKIDTPSVSFSDLPYPQVGLCKLYSSGYWEVKIDRTYWSKTSHESKIGLVLHELGHCVLRRGHDDTFMVNNNYQAPKSLMYPYNFYDRNYLFMWDYYAKELFQPGIQFKGKTITIVN